MPWAQGVVSSNLAAPTKVFIFSIILASNQRWGRRRAPASGAVDPLICIENVGFVGQPMTKR